MAYTSSYINMHDTLYVSVYTCTHYGRKDHLVKFCYDRIYNSNFTNKFVWVRKCANPHGRDKVWAPKSTSILFNVGVGSRLT